MNRRTLSSQQPIRVGLIGAGEVTQVIHMPTLLLMPHDFKVMAICDVSQEAIDHVQRKFNVPKAFLKSSELVKQDDIDLVMVVNSDEYHAINTIEAADAGKHVFIEKPMALTEKEAADIEAARVRNNVSIYVGYMRRYAPAFDEFQRILGESGPIRHVIVKDIIGPNSHFVGQSGTFPQRFTQDIPVSASSERASLASTLASNALGSRSNSARLTNIYRLLGSLGSHDLSLMRDTLGGVPSRCMSAFASADGMFITAQFLYEAGPPSSSASAPARVSTTQTGDDETAREEGSPPASAFVATYTTGIHNVGIFDASVEVITDDRVIRIDYDTPYVKGLPITISVKENDKGAAGAGAGGSYSERIIRPTYLDAYSSQFALVANALRGTGPELKTTPKDAAEDLKIFKMIMDQL